MLSMIIEEIYQISLRHIDQNYYYYAIIRDVINNNKQGNFDISIRIVGILPLLHCSIIILQQAVVRQFHTMSERRRKTASPRA